MDAKGRSALMSRIKGQDTQPEQILRAALWQRGLRYRLHHRTPVGRPDIVFPGSKVAVFVDGCFWHGCPDHYVRPRSRAEFWARRLRENVERDRRQTLELESIGWVVLRFWEHEVATDLPHLLLRVDAGLLGDHDPDLNWRVVAVEPLDASGSQEKRLEETLRDSSHSRVIEQQRHTRKWVVAKSEALPLEPDDGVSSDFIVDLV